MPKGKNLKPSKKAKKAEKQDVSEAELKKQILELAKQGLTSEKIGEQLRKKGIHTKEKNIKISKILKENNMYINPDLKNIEVKLERVKAHYAKNKQDKRAMREKDRIFAQLRILKKYSSK